MSADGGGAAFKVCSCGVSYDGEDWLTLRLVGHVGRCPEGRVWHAVELRDCRKCGSTIGVNVAWSNDALLREVPT